MRKGPSQARLEQRILTSRESSSSLDLEGLFPEHTRTKVGTFSTKRRLSSVDSDTSEITVSGFRA